MSALRTEPQDTARYDDLSIGLRDTFLDSYIVFTVTQLRLFHDFDDLLRRGSYDRAYHSIPGGYDDFQSLWNIDHECAYRFCSLSASGEVTVRGPPIPIDVLAPLPAEPEPAPVAAPEPAYDNDQVGIINGLLWDVARRDQKNRSFIASKRAARLASKDERTSKRPRAAGPVTTDGPSAAVITEPAAPGAAAPISSPAPQIPAVAVSNPSLLAPAIARSSPSTGIGPRVTITPTSAALHAHQQELSKKKNATAAKRYHEIKNAGASGSGKGQEGAKPATRSSEASKKTTQGGSGAGNLEDVSMKDAGAADQ